MFPDSKIPEKLRFQALRPLFVFLSVWIITASFLAIKIPSAFRKVYAEDGVSLQQSLGNPFPRELFEPVAGYFDILLRGTAVIVSLFPLDLAPKIFFAVNTFLLASLWMSVFISSRTLMRNYRWRILVATGLLLLPIGSFESIANSANLHFYFMSACLVILLSTPQNTTETYFMCTIIFLSATSIPLMILTFPLVVVRYLMKERSSRSWRDSAIIAAWISGNISQLIYILATALGQRKSTGLNTPTEVVYLYLDRVFGSTLIPFWGMVSTSTRSPIPNLFGDSGYLVLRAAFAFVLLVALASLTIKFCHFTFDHRLKLLTIIGTGLGHWLIVGTMFNPEPRYAIFSSYSVFLALLYSLQFVKAKRAAVECVAILMVMLTWIGSWPPSTLRTEGPLWRAEFLKAKSDCLDGANYVYITTIPINKVWRIKLDCYQLLKSS